MIRARRRHPVALALYLNAAVLLALMAVLLTRDSSPRLIPVALGQAAQQQPAPIAGGAGLFLMPAQFSENVWGCYIMDVDQQTLCAYTVSGSPPQLKLVAARDFRFDRRLKNYNTQHPSPQEVKELVEKELNDTRATAAPPAPPPPQPQTPAPSPEKPQ
jgi:hypothetical protein